MAKPRVIVLGIDGATWHLLRPWVKEGELPNLAALMAQGGYGDLASTIPPYTAPAWTSFATGKEPGKHGVVDFWRFSWESRERVPIDVQRVQPATFWSILSRQGLRVGVVNVPMTYPPYPVNGVMISGMLTPDGDTDFTSPATLKAELRNAIGDYVPNPYASVSQTATFLEKTAYWIRQRERANQYLLKTYEFDCFVNVIQAPDPIQHQFWRMLDAKHLLYDEAEAERFRPMLLESYRAVDEVIGRRLDMLDDRTRLFVVSDHGFGPAQKYFFVNQFLAELGVLVFKEGSGEAESYVKGRVLPLLSQLARFVDFLNLRHRFLNNRQREAIRQRLDQAAAQPVDWTQTQAYFSGLTGESIYVHLRETNGDNTVKSGTEYEGLRDKIIHALLGLRDPDTGEAVVAGAYRREEMYSGPYVEQLPDIVFSMGEHPYLPSERLATSDVIGPLPATAGGGRHQPMGIFLAAGGVRAGATFTGARIVDLAPTILFSLGVPIPEDMDGQVLTDLFETEFMAAHPVQFGSPVSIDAMDAGPAYSEDEAKAVRAHLQELGYLD